MACRTGEPGLQTTSSTHKNEICGYVIHTTSSIYKQGYSLGLQVMKTAVTASTSRRQCCATRSRQMPPRGSIDAPARQWRPWDPWRPSLLSNTGQKRPNQHTQLQLNKEECSLCLSFLSSPQCYLPRRLQAPLLCFTASHWSHLTAQAPQLPYPATILRLHVPNRMTEC